MKIRKLKLLVMTLASITIATQCNMQNFVMKKVMSRIGSYFTLPNAPATSWDKVSENVYSFRSGFDRSLILKSTEGAIVIDSFNKKHSSLLKKEIDKHLKLKVHTLIYSHYHLDHVGGGEELHPLNVEAPVGVEPYWKVVTPRNLLKPAKYYKGDKIVKLGKLTIDYISLPKGHTDHLYAYLITDSNHKSLFAPDMGFVKAIPPAGLPDMYLPGYLKGLDKLSKLEFETFIPSHFNLGKKQDFLNYIKFMKDMRRLSLQAYKKYGRPENSETFVKFYDEVYPYLNENYGKWHGFDSMLLVNLIRHFTGIYLGY